jgi:UDP-glucuronate 4-epimerase
MKVFVTGAAGFIGAHLSRSLIAAGHQVLGYDGMTAYYDMNLKRARLRLLEGSNGFTFVEAMLEDKEQLNSAIFDFAPDVIVHLAAQAGVRYSLENPEAYISANVAGTFNILEAARTLKPRHLLIASTSSVYGGNEKMPFEEADRSDFPISLYAATKKAGEAMSHAYAHLFGIPTTNFRFFTVYGPWGRPDMALFRFVCAMRNGAPIEVYGEGKMRRDFTYIDDLVEGIIRLMDAVPQRGKPISCDGVRDSLSPVAPWRVVNIAGGDPVGLLAFIDAIEAATGLTAIKQLRPMQQGDVTETFADAGLLQALTGYVPQTKLDEGVRKFVEWYDGWVKA